MRVILGQEVAKYRNRFLLSVLFWIPIMICAWIIPYCQPEFVTDNVWIKGNTLYIFLMFTLATIIQFGLGLPFYIGAYKSLK